ncbi:MAG: hypothetical protein K0U98_08070 [Deltaproteobacteria bacterium]|nr:hypothetical protein [Deltaproteobacteria bacterium]
MRGDRAEGRNQGEKPLEGSSQEIGLRQVVFRHGGSEAVAEELVTYLGKRNLDAAPRLDSSWPPEEEPHVDWWRQLLGGEEPIGPVSRSVWEDLQEAFPQLRFPVLRGLSETAVYRAAVRRGQASEGATSHLELRSREGLEVRLLATAAGQLPVLVAEEREDFEALFQVLTARNEPVEVPASLGACLVSGIVNWRRVRRYRQDWESRQGSTFLLHAGWELEMAKLRQNKQLYQDRFLLLSRGAYSGLDATEVGMGEAQWLEASLRIRQEHEAAHYLLQRSYPGQVPQIVDEVLADLAGIVEVFGSYRTELALRFLGLEAFPDYRSGGRLENYLGDPALSPAAFEILQGLVFEAIIALGRQAEEEPEILRDPERRARRIVQWGALGLHQLGGGI